MDEIGPAIEQEGIEGWRSDGLKDVYTTMLIKAVSVSTVNIASKPAHFYLLVKIISGVRAFRI